MSFGDTVQNGLYVSDGISEMLEIQDDFSDCTEGEVFPLLPV